MVSRTVLFLFGLLASWIFAGCSAGNDSKGEESPLPDDGRADSFRTPTDNGVLNFQDVNQATFSEDHLYHLWNFSLIDRADVSLWVEAPDTKLDTVMYLYYRKDEAQKWGAYLLRNDDYNNQPWSGIAANLEAGWYRVLVKGFSSNAQGQFSLHVQCSGPGCTSTGSPELNDNDPLKIVINRTNSRFGDANINDSIIHLQSMRWMGGQAASPEDLKALAKQLLPEVFENLLYEKLPEVEIAVSEVVDSGDDNLEELSERLSSEGFGYAPENASDRCWVYWSVAQLADWLDEESNSSLVVTADTSVGYDEDRLHVSLTVFSNSNSGKLFYVFILEGTSFK